MHLRSGARCFLCPPLGWVLCCPHADALPHAAWVVRLRSEFSRKQFVSATSEPLKRAVRAELEQLLGRVLTRPAVPERVHVV